MLSVDMMLKDHRAAVVATAIVVGETVDGAVKGSTYGRASRAPEVDAEVEAARANGLGVEERGGVERTLFEVAAVAERGIGGGEFGVDAGGEAFESGVPLRRLPLEMEWRNVEGCEVDDGDERVVAREPIAEGWSVRYGFEASLSSGGICGKGIDDDYLASSTRRCGSERSCLIASSLILACASFIS